MPFQSWYAVQDKYTTEVYCCKTTALKTNDWFSYEDNIVQNLEIYWHKIDQMM